MNIYTSLIWTQAKGKKNKIKKKKWSNLESWRKKANQTEHLSWASQSFLSNVE